MSGKRIPLLAKLPAVDPQRAGRQAARSGVNIDSPVTIRRATEADLSSVHEIAQLDSQWPPTPPFLVAEVGEEIVAAIAPATDVVVANPFRYTAHAVALLRLRAEQLTPGRPLARIRRRRVSPAPTTG